MIHRHDAPIFSRITGTGSYLPPQRVTNAELADATGGRGIETSDEWIVERTGIRARHFAAPDVAASDLGAARRRAHALEAAGCDAARHRPDHRRHLDARHGVPVVPPRILQHKLGIAGCAGVRRAGRVQRLRLRADGRGLDDQAPAPRRARW